MNWAVSVINKPRLNYQVTNVVDDTAYFSASAPSGTRTTVADGQEFSAVFYKASEPETSRSVDKNNFTYPSCIWRLHWG